MSKANKKNVLQKNWKFATKNKSGTAQIDDIGDMRATSKRAAAVSTPAKRTRASGRVTKANVPRSLGFLRSGFPKQMQMRHRYAESFPVNVIANVDVWQLYRCNGMYDPRVAIGGHQPMYFQRMGATYDHYVVTGATIRIDTVVVDSNVTPPDSQAAIVGVYIEDDTTVNPTSMASKIEQGTAVYKTVTRATPSTIYSKWKVASTFGKYPQANSILRGSLTSDPVEEQMFCIWVTGQGVSGSDTVRVQVTILIEYDAIWFELKYDLSA